MEDLFSQLAGAQGRRDEEPNKALGRALASAKDVAGINMIAIGLAHKDLRVRTDCIAVLEEAARIEPTLVSSHVNTLIDLLDSKHNRLVWEAMITLALVAPLCPVEIYDRVGEVRAAMAAGSVITVDNGVKVLAAVAAANDEFNREIIPELLEIVRTCQEKSVAQYAESIQPAVAERDRNAFEKVLGARLPALSAAQAKRIKHLLSER